MRPLWSLTVSNPHLTALFSSVSHLASLLSICSLVPHSPSASCTLLLLPTLQHLRPTILTSFEYFFTQRCHPPPNTISTICCLISVFCSVEHLFCPPLIPVHCSWLFFSSLFSLFLRLLSAPSSSLFLTPLFPLQTPRGSPFTEITWPSALSVPRHPRCPHTVSLHFQRSLDQSEQHSPQCAAHPAGRYTTLHRSYSTQV